MNPPWVLVLDVGSSSVRVRLYDRRAKELDPGPEAQRFYEWRADPAGAMEVPAEDLFRLVEYALDAALARAREARLEIAAVGVVTFWHSLLGLAADGTPLTPVYAWGDTRAGDVALELAARLDEAALHGRTGCFLHPSYPAVKLAWLRREDPDAFARAAAWVSFAEYLEGRLFGERRCSLSMASGTGLLDVRRLRWDAEMLDAAGLTEARLSPLVDLDEPLRGLRPTFARRWPELASVPWFPALGDGACANAGSGAVGVERVGVTVGTSAAVRALWEPEGELVVPESLWCYRLDRRRCVAGGALSNGGNAFAWLSRTTRLGPKREWEAELAALEPDAHGLTILPYLLAERGPGWLTETRAVVLGPTQATTPVELLRAWLEAVAYRLARVYDRLGESLGGAASVYGSGGALHASPVWSQILADVIGRPLALGTGREASGRGGALAVQERLGWLADLRDAPLDPAATFAPDPARHERYRAAMRRQAELESTLEPWLARGGQHSHPSR